MPTLTVPEDFPVHVRAAVAVLGNAARIEILRRCMTKDQTAPDLAAQIGMSGVSAWRHVQALEELGLVTADRSAGDRAGMTVRWRTEVTAVEAMIDGLAHYLSAE